MGAGDRVNGCEASLKMTDNVVPIGADVVLTPELVIDEAKKADLQTVVIIGFDADVFEPGLL